MKWHRNLKYVWLVLMMLQPHWTEAQFFHSGQAPASVQWSQIRHPKIRLIFPVGMEQQATSLMRTMDTLMPGIAAGLAHRARPIPLVLYPGGVISNGLTAWAPRRMEFYTTPPQDNYSQDWLQQLAIHEYRHVVQIDKLNQGMTRVLGWIFGEQILAGILGLYVPSWFLEGDAVMAETTLSRAGRGREPSFTAPLRAQLSQFGRYSYEKATFGSYRDYVPNAYILGYHLTAFGVKRFGERGWQEALNRTARRPWSITPFSAGLRSGSGFSRGQWYKTALHELDSIWKQEEINTNSLFTPLLIENPSVYTDYLRPQVNGQGDIIAERYALNDVDRIVAIHPDGKEQILATPGLMMKGSLEVKGNHALWTEYQPDPRWDQRSFTRLIHFDLDRNRRTVLLSGTRYFSPALSHDTKSLALVESPEAGRARLILMSFPGCEHIKTWQDDRYVHLMQPEWHADGRHIVLLAQDSTGARHLLLVDLQALTSRSLLGPTFTSMQHPVPDGAGIWWTGDDAGEEAIFWTKALEPQAIRFAVSRFGISQPAPDGKGNLIATTYTAHGHHPVRLPTAKAIPYQTIRTTGIQEPLLLQHSEQSIDSHTDTTWQLNIQPYRRINNLFRFHSWGPVYVDGSQASAGPGFSLMSQDLLNTSFLTAGYQYDYAEQSGSWKLNYRYEGWYPKLSLSSIFAQRQATGFRNDGQAVDYAWREYQLESGVELPLQWMLGHHWTGILPRLTSTQIWLKMDEDSPFRFKREKLQTLDYGFIAYHLRKQSRRDLQPAWGQVLEVRYRHDPFLVEAGNIWAAMATLYFPGLAPHHGWQLYAGYQERKQGEYIFSGMVRYPSGTIGRGEEQLKSLSLRYRFPLGMPDANLPGLVYIKRIKGALFLDMAEARAGETLRYYRSTGAELRLDAHFFRFIAPVDIGVRAIRNLEENKWTAEFLFSVLFSDL